MNCTFCKQPITLSPSAAERAASTGMPAGYFTGLFKIHSECALHKREVTTAHLMAWGRKETPRINRPNTQHLYRLGLGERFLDVEANNRDQAVRIAESYGYEVHDCNMIG